MKIKTAAYPIKGNTELDLEQLGIGITSINEYELKNSRRVVVVHRLVWNPIERVYKKDAIVAGYKARRIRDKIRGRIEIIPESDRESIRLDLTERFKGKDIKVIGFW